MLITDLLKDNNISFEELGCILKISEGINYTSDKLDDYIKLEKKGFIRIIIDNQSNFIYKLKPKALELLSIEQEISNTINNPVSISPNIYFEEFWNIYPSHDGYGQFKRTRSLKANKEGCNTKYNQYIKSGIKHGDIIKALEFEIEDRKKSNSMKFMKNSLTWLNQKEWEVVNEMIEKDEDTKDDWTTQLS